MLTGLGGVAAGVLIFLVVLAVAGPRSTQRTEGARFKVGPAERLGASVARDGPLLFQDLLNRSRDIYVQHLGGDDWRAFEAHAPGAPRRCVLRWRPEDRRFLDPCDGRTFPAEGTGLTSYRTEVDEDGVVLVDLRTPVSMSMP
ncbi:MAG: hypothetical protein M3144_05925 [Actinomycetota bacterium]|nr:hypothetical protein [Actinomycetota bacterium]